MPRLTQKELQETNKCLAQLREPQHVYAGSMCQCKAPLYRRGDFVFCTNCRNPRSKTKFNERKNKADCIPDSNNNTSLDRGGDNSME